VFTHTHTNQGRCVIKSGYPDLITHPPFIGACAIACAISYSTGTYQEIHVNNNQPDFELIFSFTLASRARYHSNYGRGASLKEVLLVAGLLDAYNHFFSLFASAELFFEKCNQRAAFDCFYRMWFSPDIIPALLLRECYYARELILPNWYAPDQHYVYNLKKSTNKQKFPAVSTDYSYDLKLVSQVLSPSIQPSLSAIRTILIPNKQKRICMGVINSFFQAACKSWNIRTVGFRPGYGTHTAINMLADLVKINRKEHGNAYILSFDLKSAFNSVNLEHLFKTLYLKALPGDIKYLLWQWHNMPNNLDYDNAHTRGLIQGLNYSPTLFAWYLDKILVKRSKLIAYADNFVGVYESIQAAENALRDAQLLLQGSGLIINPQSISICCSPHLATPYLYPWLGHALSLPNCKVIFRKFQQPAFKKTPIFITIDQWRYMLQATDWVNGVQRLEWVHLLTP
jgi:hypothetical protein